MVDRQVIDRVRVRLKYKNIGDPNIGDMKKLLFKSKGIITPSVVMIQLSKISCGGTLQSRS